MARDSNVSNHFKYLKPEEKYRLVVPQLLKDCITEMDIFKNEEDIHKLQPYKAEWWG